MAFFSVAILLVSHHSLTSDFILDKEISTMLRRRDQEGLVVYGRASTLVTSQIPIERWYDIIAEPTMADAILDRLVYNAHKITLKGESMRKRKAENLDDKLHD